MSVVAAHYLCSPSIRLSRFAWCKSTRSRLSVTILTPAASPQQIVGSKFNGNCANDNGVGGVFHEQPATYVHLLDHDRRNNAYYAFCRIDSEQRWLGTGERLQPGWRLYLAVQLLEYPWKQCGEGQLNLTFLQQIFDNV